MRVSTSSAVSTPPTDTSSTRSPTRARSRRRTSSERALERRAGHPARVGEDLGRCEQARARDRRVGRDQAVELGLDGEVRELVELLFGEVGRELDQHGAVRLPPHRGDQLAQVLDRLQVPQPGVFGRADVDDHEVRVRREQLRRGPVVGGRVLQRRDLRLADVDRRRRRGRERRASVGAAAAAPGFGKPIAFSRADRAGAATPAGAGCPAARRR